MESYLTSFDARLQGQDAAKFSDRQHMVRRRILGGTFEMIDAASASKGTKQGLRVKAALHALLNRSGLTYYPASSREGHTRDPQYVHLNHDGCAIVGGQQGSD